MTENSATLTISVLAVVSALGSLAVVVCKLVKKSSCFGFELTTRTPNETLAPPPSPATFHSHRHQKEETMREVEV